LRQLQIFSGSSYRYINPYLATGCLAMSLWWFELSDTYYSSPEITAFKMTPARATPKLVNKYFDSTIKLVHKYFDSKKSINNTTLKPFITHVVNTFFINTINTIDLLFTHSLLPKNVVPSSIYKGYGRRLSKTPTLKSTIILKEYLVAQCSFNDAVVQQPFSNYVREFKGCEAIPALYLSEILGNYKRGKSSGLQKSLNSINVNMSSCCILLPRNLTFRLVKITSMPSAMPSACTFRKITPMLLTRKNKLTNAALHRFITVHTYELISSYTPSSTLPLPPWDMPDKFKLISLACQDNIN
jgi:hypothetical protein